MKVYKFKITAYTDAAGKCNPNAPRNGNEDNMFVCANLSATNAGYTVDANKEIPLNKDGCLMVVADGMGGMKAGEVASEIAINIVKESFAPDTLDRTVLKSGKSRARFMERVVGLADQAIKQHASQHPECEGMGSTIILVWICGGQATITWCGDSRAYLYRAATGLKQISKDHSYVQELVDAGQITMDEAFDHPYNNVITRSLGDPNHNAKADSISIPIYKGDIILVNSDGLSGVLRDSEMEAIIRNNGNDIGGCRAALWKAARDAGWYDNVTAILCCITEGAKYDATTASIDCSRDDGFLYLRIRKTSLIWVAAVLTVLAIGCVCALLFFNRNKHASIDNPNSIESEEVVDTSRITAPAPEKGIIVVKSKDTKSHREKDTVRVNKSGNKESRLKKTRRLTLTPVKDSAKTARTDTTATIIDSEEI